MSLVVVGLHRRDAPLDVLERVAIAERDLPKALGELCDSPHLAEAAVLSTCMRTEVYAVLERFHDGLSDIHGFFEGRLGPSPGGSAALADGLFVAYDDAAARHLLEVAAGIDSAVLGEGEVLRQVRRAGERAHHERAAGPMLGGLFRHAVEVGKRVRTDTAIARGVTSLAHVAVALIGEHLGSLEERTIVVVGAGEIGESLVEALAQRGPGPRLVVVNRGQRRAEALAERTGARAAPLRDLPVELAIADVVVVATAADQVVIEEGDVVRARGGGERPLLVIDAGLPRNVDPAVGELEGVTLLDIATLTAFAKHGRASRHREIARVEAIVEEELERYQLVARSRSVAPLIAQLRGRAEELRLAELGRLRPLLERLDPDPRRQVEEMSRRLVAKLLHEPTVELKVAAGTSKGERLAEALRTLFEL